VPMLKELTGHPSDVASAARDAIDRIETWGMCAGGFEASFAASA
jgi:hypothetical protein